MDSCELPLPYNDDADFKPPEYTCSVHLTGNFLCKQELVSPLCAAACRAWSRVEAEVRGTLLLVRRVSRLPVLGTDTRSYTLQAAAAGLATDYHRRSHVLRVRAEGQQFLLAAANLSTIIDWVDKLNAAIAVSLPIEDRREARYRTLPPPAALNLASNADVMDGFQRRLREDWCLLSRQRLWLMESQSYPEGQQQRPALPLGHSDPTCADTGNESRNKIRQTGRLSSTCPCANCWTSTPRAHTRPLSTTPRVSWARSPSGILVACPITQNTQEPATPRPSICEPENDKWEPKAIMPTAQASLDYARRCASGLTYSAAWKGRYYVRDGRVVPIPNQGGPVWGSM